MKSGVEFMKKVQVCGDPTLDWLWVRNPDQANKSGVYFWLSQQFFPKIGLGSQAGGSALMYSLVKKLAADKAIVEGTKINKRLLKEPEHRDINASWTMWDGYVEKGRSKPSFRICEWMGFEPGEWDYENNKLIGETDLLLIEDSGIGFRDHEKGWPDALSGKIAKPQYIILKLSKYNKPEVQNPLVQKIRDLGLCGATTVVTAINDLRSCSIRIGPSLSWEKIFDEIVDAVYSPNCIFADRETGELLFDRVIVTVGVAGAVIVSHDNNVLIFDRSGQEEDFAHKYEGELMGYNTCLMGALAMKWLDCNPKTDWTKAVWDGIALSRFLCVDGYAVLKEKKRAYLQFPIDGINNIYNSIQKGEPQTDKITDLGVYCNGRPGRRDAAEKRKWSILEETVGDDCGAGYNNRMKAVCDCAKAIVKSGPESALKNVPIETVGGWTSADRQEIEGIRSVNNAFRYYLTDKSKQETPLCIAVFGPPGSGKSFAIKEIAKGLGIDKESQITFNLSQFESPEELTAAFHRIRDLQLKGKVPLIFWDEFDSLCKDRPLGWLRYFLAPMQDGEFMENGRTHPIGRGIFVFAGATRHSFSKFCDGANEDDIAAKKPDFISRLRAYIDIKGPNGNPNTIEDNLFIVRRAFLLHNFLRRHTPNIREGGTYQIEDGVLNAFLRVGEYKHGARSMETLIRMSTVGNKRKYEYSCLPPDQITGMHVNTDEFLSLMQYGQREMMRIGITGHIGLNPDHIGKIETTVREAISFMEKQFLERYLTVFSSVALGTDRLVARLMLEKEGSALIAVLPVPKEEYINDFGKTDQHNVDYEGSEARQEFRYWLANRAIEIIELPFVQTRNDAYLQAGCFIAEHCDLLIAVWDGKKAAGKGGTGDIVREAERLDKPIVHIWAGNHKNDESKRTEVGEKLGTFRYKNIQNIKEIW
jgi:hypothetical protein